MMPHGARQIGAGGMPGSVPTYFSVAVSARRIGASLTSVTLTATVAGSELDDASWAVNSNSSGPK